MKLEKSSHVLGHGVGRGCVTEMQITAIKSKSDHRIEKVKSAGDVPLRPQALNRSRFFEAGVQVGAALGPVETNSVLHNLAHLVMLFDALGVSVLRESAPEIDRFSDIDDDFRLIIEAINARSFWNGAKKFFAKSAIKTSSGHSLS